MLVLDGVQVPPPAADSVLEQGSIKVMNSRGSGGFSWVADLTSYQGWSGDRRLNMDISWKVGQPKSTGGGKSPALSVAQQQYVQQRAKEIASKTLAKMMNNSSENQVVPLMSIRPAGPIWSSDPSAATCSEVDIEDGLPPSATAAG
jgi:hypothetical protein